MQSKTVQHIATDKDIVAAREAGRRMAIDVGFHGLDLVFIATAISEVARNIVSYAGDGEMELTTLDQHPGLGLQIIARDDGPGIANLELAMQEGYSTGAGLGMGLPGSRRLMDEFDVRSDLGKGTTVTMRKWLGSM
jgi:serine/threonine-protein kinase RsbT